MDWGGVIGAIRYDFAIASAPRTEVRGVCDERLPFSIGINVGVEVAFPELVGKGG